MKIYEASVCDKDLKILNLIVKADTMAEAESKIKQEYPSYELFNLNLRTNTEII